MSEHDDNWMMLRPNAGYPDYKEFHRRDEWCTSARCIPACNPETICCEGGRFNQPHNCRKHQPVEPSPAPTGPREHIKGCQYKDPNHAGTCWPETWAAQPSHPASQSPPATEGMSATKCIGDDPSCPCRDGDACHYKGDNPFSLPSAYQRSAVLAPEAEGMEARLAEFDKQFDPRPILYAHSDMLAFARSEVVSQLEASRNSADTGLKCPKCGNVSSFNIRNGHIDDPPERTTVECYVYGCHHEAHISKFKAAAIRKQIAELGKLATLARVGGWLAARIIAANIAMGQSRKAKNTSTIAECMTVSGRTGVCTANAMKVTK